jgi:hypothetical protein
MPDNSTADHLNTEALYEQLLDLVMPKPSLTSWEAPEINPDDFRRAMDSILAMGKIIGRRDALKDQPRMPVVGEIWRDQGAPFGKTEILAVSATGSVTHRRMQCSQPHIPHPDSDHVGTRPLSSFLRLYEPTTPAYDRLIEDWTKIVEADIR